MKNYIKVERAKINITQQELANAVQVSRQTINSIETQKYVPSTILSLKIALFFKVAVEQLFELEIED
ncbi:MAG: helix-turn-helix transcriptional regulator [Flavobacterium sp.]|nr:helix-turn-helix transcriptional regulator [Flavobacterium sp.]